jgi:hypothetical protein
MRIAKSNENPHSKERLKDKRYQLISQSSNLDHEFARWSTRGPGKLLLD